MNLLVRKAAAADWDAVNRVCGETGMSGDPVDPAEREGFVRHWIEPYRELRPEWTWVAVVEGAVVAYLTAAPDSLEFEKERRRVFSPSPDSRDFFSQAVRVKLWTEHPAHFLLNVLPDYRGMGVASRLLQVFFAEARKAGVPSVHLVCGPSSFPFWERMAFRAEALVQPAPGVVLRAMTRPTS